MLGCLARCTADGEAGTNSVNAHKLERSVDEVCRRIGMAGCPQQAVWCLELLLFCVVCWPSIESATAVQHASRSVES